MIWLLVAILFVAYLALIWRLLGDQDDQGPMFTPDPDATVVLAAVPSWYQLDHDRRETDRLLVLAAAMLDEHAA